MRLRISKPVPQYNVKGESLRRGLTEAKDGYNDDRWTIFREKDPTTPQAIAMEEALAIKRIKSLT